ncbi:MAG: DUF2914 domain-containing protein [Gammaproteobacteria bacterium]|nr:DUF2914 domain-containing protein [Gammaproteobacteria bacterium]
MNKSVRVSILALAMGFSQFIWADGFGEEGVSNVDAYEGKPVVAQNGIEEVGVVSAVFTPGVDSDGKPMGASERFFSSVKTVFFDTELDGLEGREITHRWFYQGKMVFEEGFVVDKSKFNAVSKKHMEPRKVGEWRVEVRQKDTLLEEKTFTYLAGI